jgi:hypothetical protein
LNVDFEGKVKPSPSNPKPKWGAFVIGFLIKELIRTLWEIIKYIFSWEELGVCSLYGIPCWFAIRVYSIQIPELSILLYIAGVFSAEHCI